MNSFETTRNSHQDLEPAFAHHLRRIEEGEDLTEEQKQKLAEKASKGSGDALHRLVDSTLHPVVSLARKHHRPDLETMDLIAEGTVGLVKAASNYNEERHGLFTPYALRLARREIQTAAED